MMVLEMIVLSLTITEILSPPKFGWKRFLGMKGSQGDIKTKNPIERDLEMGKRLQEERREQEDDILHEDTDRNLKMVELPLKAHVSTKDTIGIEDELIRDLETLMKQMEEMDEKIKGSKQKSDDEIQRDIDFIGRLKEFFERTVIKISENLIMERSYKFLKTMKDFFAYLEYYEIEIFSASIFTKHKTNEEIILEYFETLVKFNKDLIPIKDRVDRLCDYQSHLTKYEHVSDIKLSELIKNANALPRALNDLFGFHIEKWDIHVFDRDNLVEQFRRQLGDDSIHLFQNVVKDYTKYQNKKNNEQGRTYEDGMIQVYEKLGEILEYLFDESGVRMGFHFNPRICTEIQNESDRLSCEELMLVITTDGILNLAYVLKKLKKSA